jgi:hypothetical protein
MNLPRLPQDGIRNNERGITNEYLNVNKLPDFMLSGL